MGRTAPLVAGIDGCRGGWVVVTGPLRPDGAEPVTAEVVATVAPVVDRLERGPLAVAAIDMPIGLPDLGPRRCDREARALLGERRSSVFPAPVRATVGAADYDQARDRSRAASGRALSVQAYNLLPRITELDRLLRSRRCDRMVESHPELAFLRLAEGIPLPAKRTAEGRRRRSDLVAPVLGGLAPTDLAEAAGAPVGDLLDAAALVATARHLAAGTARLLGDGEHDSTGLPMRIAW